MGFGMRVESSHILGAGGSERWTLARLVYELEEGKLKGRVGTSKGKEKT